MSVYAALSILNNGDYISWVKLVFTILAFKMLSKSKYSIIGVAFVLFSSSIVGVVMEDYSKLNNLDIIGLIVIFYMAFGLRSKLVYVCLLLLIFQSYLLSFRTYLFIVPLLLIYALSWKFLSKSTLAKLGLSTVIGITGVHFIIGHYFYIGSELIEVTGSNVGRSIMTYAVILSATNLMPMGSMEALNIVQTFWPTELVKIYFFNHIDTHNGLSNILMLYGLPVLIIFLYWFYRFSYELFYKIKDDYNSLVIYLLLILVFSFDTFSIRAMLDLSLLAGALSYRIRGKRLVEK